MIQTLEAKIGPDGRVSLLEPVTLAGERRALVTVLDESPAPDPQSLAGSALECMLMSEAALAKDWLRPEEDEAWAYLDELPDIDEEDQK